MPILMAACAPGGNASIGVAIRPAMSNVVAKRFTVRSPDGPGAAHSLERHGMRIVDARLFRGPGPFIQNWAAIHLAPQPRSDRLRFASFPSDALRFPLLFIVAQ